MLSQLRGRIEARGRCENRLENHTGLHLRNRVVVVILLLFTLGLRVRVVAAQGFDSAALLKPATDAWPTYNGDYSGRRFSTLDQINAGNVGSLTLAWVFQPHASTIKSTPLEVNGILYFTVPDNVWAVDARFGREIWHYQRTSEGDHIGNRGLGMYKS
ncbi:MAG: Pyrrolo-quinoline quinone, partial [Candidatus Acidoferrum typicum]|nr:Pyrrolo-quinoline quinone [Candidatus Acidoferrum typicum]